MNAKILIYKKENIQNFDALKQLCLMMNIEIVLINNQMVQNKIKDLLNNKIKKGKESEFVLINVAGKSKVRITDGKEEYIVELNKPMMGVYLPKMIWKDMYDFSSDSVLLVLASTHYDGKEYIRNYDEYLEIMGVNND